MAEKRKGGLGRGLGSLIPTPETGRPADVFFPRSERDEAAVTDGSEAEGSSPRRSADPAESMRRAQAGRRTAAPKKAPAKTGKSAASGASEKGQTKRTDSARETAGPEQKASGGSRKASAAKPKTGAASNGTAKQRAAGKGATAAGKAAAAAEAESEKVSTSTAQRVRDVTEPVDRGVVGEGPAAQPSPVNTGDTPSAATVDNPVETAVDAAVDQGEAAGAVSRGTGDEQELVPVPGTTFGEIPIELIRPNPRQPREVFDEDALEELVTSIREIGVLQPVVVRRRSDDPAKYELIMGERRFRASQEAGRTSVPAIVRETSDDDLLRDALLENLHRVDLNPLEEAAAYAQLLEDFDCTQEELSGRIGRSRPQISNTLRLLKLPPMVQRRVAAGVLSSGHARAILGLNDAAQMEVLAQRVVAEGLSVRATEEAVVLLNRGEKPAVSRGTKEADPALTELARSIGDRLETRVNVTMGKRKGKLSVEFADQADLKRILELLGISQ
ncbi:hypothetical protein GCM10009823_14110 [Brevibacterium salitolerans]|uniref:ParB-like N-terminal domain-containing protein n=1 Tax=Brevibacterium salitolerans TaxID=1403566 RepID=A0ABN2WM81_9MICO